MIKKFFYSIFDCYKNYCEREKAILEFDRFIDSGIIKKRGYMNHGIYMNIFYVFAKTKDGDISIFFTEGIVGYKIEIKINGKYIVFIPITKNEEGKYISTESNQEITESQAQRMIKSYQDFIFCRR